MQAVPMWPDTEMRTIIIMNISSLFHYEYVYVHIYVIYTYIKQIVSFSSLSCSLVC